MISWRRILHNQLHPYRGCPPDLNAGWKRTWSLEFGFHWVFDKNFKRPHLREDRYSKKNVEKSIEGPILQVEIDGQMYMCKTIRRL